MEVITSKQNNLIKKVKSLHEKKHREELGLSFCEGIKMVKEAIGFGEVTDIIYTQKYIETELLKSLQNLNKYNIVQVSEEVFKYISTQNTPDGILATFNIKNQNSLLPKITTNFLVLDEVSDPTNLGTIIRTASAFGYKNILLLNNCCDAFSPKVISASRGGIFKVNCTEVSLNNLLDIKKDKIKLIAADINGKDFRSKNIQSVVYGIVLGNESNGISNDVIKACDETVTILMEDGNESLNVSVAAGILMQYFRNMV